MTLAFGAVAATCATTAALRVGLPPMASLHTRGLSLSPPAATPARLEALRPLGAAPDPRLASLGAGVDPQVPLPGGGAPADRPVAGAGIYQPDWDEIDLGDDFRGVADEVEESDGAAGRSDGSFQRRFERPERAPRLEARRSSSSLGGSGSYPYEDDGSIPWTRRLIPGYRGVDFAALVAALLVQASAICGLVLLYGGNIPPVGTVVAWAVIGNLLFIIKIYYYAIIGSIIMSFVMMFSGNPNPHPLLQLVWQLTEPVMAPIRSVIPAMGGLDFSPIVIFLGIQFLQNFIIQTFGVTTTMAAVVLGI